MKRRASKKNRLLRVLLFLLGGGVLAGVIAYFAVSAWIQNYLRGDACREILERQIGAAAGARCRLEPLSWTGTNVYSAKISLTPLVTSGWKQVEADGVQATLDFNGVRRGTWSVPAISLDWLRVDLPDAATAGAPAVAPEVPPASTAAPAWLRRWLPARTEIGGVDVNTFDLKPSAPAVGVAVEGLQLKAKPGAEDGAWQLRGSGGKLSIPGLAEAFRMNSVSARLDAKALVLHDATARWLGNSEVTARGELPFSKDKGWGFLGHVSNLDLRQLLSEEWNPKLSGVIEGDYDVSASSGVPVLTKGKLRVKSGVVQALPVLERVADFTHTARFRRVVLDEASGVVEVQGGRIRVTKLVLQSNGLIRLEGDFTAEGRAITGNFLAGVAPETLRWMPGAQNHVFTDSNAGGVPGFVWTRVRVSGTLDSPKEDLSNRLLAAMGKAVLLDAPMAVLGTGAKVLDKTGGAALQGGKAVLDGGKDVIKGTGDVLGKGVDTIKGIIPLFPK